MRKDEIKPDSPKESSVQFSKQGGLNDFPEGYDVKSVKDAYYSADQKHLMVNFIVQKKKSEMTALFKSEEGRFPIPKAEKFKFRPNVSGNRCIPEQGKGTEWCEFQYTNPDVP